MDEETHRRNEERPREGPKLESNVSERVPARSGMGRGKKTFTIETRVTRKSSKGARGMPRLSEAKKDVTSCEKLRGGANGRRSGGVRMGKPDAWKMRHHVRWGERGELKHLSTRRKRKQQ